VSWCDPLPHSTSAGVKGGSGKTTVATNLQLDLLSSMTDACSKASIVVMLARESPKIKTRNHDRIWACPLPHRLFVGALLKVRT
jgi:hypothetical protein